LKQEESSGSGTAWCCARACGLGVWLQTGPQVGRVHDSLDNSCCDKLNFDIYEVELYGGELDLDGGVLQVVQS
jgi:hypothetical protein